MASGNYTRKEKDVKCVYDPEGSFDHRERGWFTVTAFREGLTGEEDSRWWDGLVFEFGPQCLEAGKVVEIREGLAVDILTDAVYTNSRYKGRPQNIYWWHFRDPCEETHVDHLRKLQEEAEEERYQQALVASREEDRSSVQNRVVAGVVNGVRP